MSMSCPKRDDFSSEVLDHIKELYGLALRFSRNHNDAEDLVQETLLRALAAWDSFKHGTNCRAWLFKILTNNFINEYRRVSKQRKLAQRNYDPLVSQAYQCAMQDPEETILESMFADEILDALALLPEPFRLVVILADLNELTYREIAHQLECPLGTVMSRLYRGRRFLEQNLTDYARDQGIIRKAA